MEVLYLLLAWFAMDAVLDNGRPSLDKQQDVPQVIELIHQEPGITLLRENQGASQEPKKEALFKKGIFYKTRYGYYMTNLVSEGGLENLKKSEVINPNITIGVLK